MKIIKNWTQFNEKVEKVNEGLIGKIAKILSKKEYDKTLKFVIDEIDGDCTKAEIKEVLSNMVFNKITKKAFKDDSMLMKSLVEELYKDCKKECK